jgi:hypothetical protein
MAMIGLEQLGVPAAFLLSWTMGAAANLRQITQLANLREKLGQLQPRQSVSDVVMRAHYVRI